MTTNGKILVIGVVFIVGMFFGRLLATPLKTDVQPEVAKTVVTGAPTVVTKTITVQADSTNWKALKSVDDQLLQTELQVIEIAEDGFKAVGSNDEIRLENDAQKLQALIPSIPGLIAKRASLLKKLGY